MQTAIPCMQLRGGSSKGLYFRAGDLPADETARDKIIIAAMGGSDPRQIDGLGGADPLTSKAAVVSLSARDDADIDYLFLQVVVGAGHIDTVQNCGNILAGVVPFAIESGMLQAGDPETVKRVYMINSGNICEVTVQTPGGRVEYAGNASIDGVPGTAAPIICNYLDVAGSACGALLPTGNRIDKIDGIEVTCIDNGMPVVVMRAADLDRSGYESRDDLNNDNELKARIESIRLQAGRMMNLGDVAAKVVPKMSLIAPPQDGGVVHTRTFIPHVCHAAIGVLGAVTVATACALPDTVAEGIAQRPGDGQKIFSIEHPSGEFSVELDMEVKGDDIAIKRAGLLRTARLLSKGEVYIPENI